jgi:glycosyltransferase involved in cell wall biosynthesis
VREPFFSICIPQYNRTSFLIEACKSMAAQTFKDFELCISDDCSTDGREQELLAFLKKSGLLFSYHKRRQKGRYDGNLRSAIHLAKGRFCLLMGNDDALASSTVLEELHADLQKFGDVGVLITNYEDFGTGSPFKRARLTSVVVGTPQVAVNNFRNFSFISGILLDRQRAQHHATDEWDGSEMYQMYLGCRILAEGKPLFRLNKSMVRKDIQVPDEKVDSYATKSRLTPCPIIERKLPMNQIGRLVADAVAPYAGLQKDRLTEEAVRQLYMFTYPFWIVEYRRVQSWKYSLGVCLGMRPRNVLKGLPLSPLRRWRVRALFAVITLMGLLVPISLFNNMKKYLYQAAKAFKSNDL